MERGTLTVVEARRAWGKGIPFVVVAVVVAALAWRGLGPGRPFQDYSNEELGEMIRLARTFQDNLRVALEPAFKPLVAAYVRDKYRSAGARVDLRSISVRKDGRFPVVVEVTGAVEGIYLQEKFLFWWDRGGWNMRYVEGDL